MIYKGLPALDFVHHGARVKAGSFDGGVAALVMQAVVMSPRSNPRIRASLPPPSSDLQANNNHMPKKRKGTVQVTRTKEGAEVMVGYVLQTTVDKSLCGNLEHYSIHFYPRKDSRYTLRGGYEWIPASLIIPPPLHPKKTRTPK